MYIFCKETIVEIGSVEPRASHLPMIPMRSNGDLQVKGAFTLSEGRREGEN